MTDKRKKDHRHENRAAADQDHDQRKKNRRERACQGYAYVEMVGWIDRREQCRRNDDRFSE